MDAMARMDRSVETVVHDLEIVLERSREFRKELTLLDATRPGDIRIEHMKELMADMQARIEGIEVFVQSCQKRAHADELPAEDIDLWM